MLLEDGITIGGKRLRRWEETVNHQKVHTGNEGVYRERNSLWMKKSLRTSMHLVDGEYLCGRDFTGT